MKTTRILSIIMTSMILISCQFIQGFNSSDFFEKADPTITEINSTLSSNAPTKTSLPTNPVKESSTTIPTPNADIQETKIPQTEFLSPPRIYITIVGHIEDGKIYTQCQPYADYHKKLLDFAESFSQEEAAFNLQIEYEFLLGSSHCETEAMRTKTGNTNLINYLAKHYGLEIDPHQEGGWDEGENNYADIRYLAGSLTPLVSDTLGGLVWDAPKQFARLANKENGLIYPDFTWHPQIGTLAVSHLHHNGDFSLDDTASGVWNPAGANQQFWQHDPNQRIIYIGPGEHSNWNKAQGSLSTLEFVQFILDGMKNGSLPRDQIYTASITVPQNVIFKPEERQKLFAILDQLKPYQESGQIVYVTYSQVAQIWQDQYNSRANIFFREGNPNK
jgi:hypothetical protein